MRGRCLLLVALILGWAEHARAEEAALPLDLDWKAPTECASAEDLRTELARIARVRAGKEPARLAARGRIEKSGGTYRLTLRTEQNGMVGERTLTAAECRSLSREVTLVLAVAFGEGVDIVPESDATQPAGDGRAARPDASNGSSSEGAPTSKIGPPEQDPRRAPTGTPAADGSAPVPRSSNPGRLRTALFLGGGVLFSALPSSAAFAVAGAEVGGTRLWIAPRFAFIPRVDESLERRVLSRYDGIGGAVSACGGVPLGSLSGSACLGGSVIALRGRSWGATETGSATAPWTTAVGTLGLEWPAGARVRLRLAADLNVSLSRPGYVVIGLGEVHRVPRLAPAVALTLVLSPFFP